MPRPYRVEFPEGQKPAEAIASYMSRTRHPILMTDRRVASLHLQANGSLAGVPRFEMDAREEEKEIGTVLRLVDFLDRNRATRASMLYVVGGGIVQDVAAFAACMFKRGVPWTFLPTTLLAQGDSGIGSKAALNHAGTKNLLGLFSAPRCVVMDVGFLETLPQSDRLSGLGEIFRLHVTGGREFLGAFERNLPEGLRGSSSALSTLIAGALSVKRAVIEVDEYELDLRRALNYGHSFGHALEALVEYRVPHGTAVTIGMLVENEIALRKGILNERDRGILFQLAKDLIPSDSRSALATVRLDGILDLLRRDKKTEGNALKLVVPENIGTTRFVDLELNPQSLTVVEECVRAVIDAL